MHSIKLSESYWDSLTGQLSPGSKLLGGVRRVKQQKDQSGPELHGQSKYWSAWTDKLNRGERWCEIYHQQTGRGALGRWSSFVCVSCTRPRGPKSSVVCVRQRDHTAGWAKQRILYNHSFSSISYNKCIWEIHIVTFYWKLHKTKRILELENGKSVHYLLIWLRNGIEYCNRCMISWFLLSKQTSGRIFIIILK